MTILTELPTPVTEIENTWIPMPDGCRLAARVWLPEFAEREPAPAIIEYIPYRKRDGTRERDEAMHRYFAGHGYAVVRIDLRGSGESDGVLHDEYLDQELDDGVAAIAWVAARPWCNGKVGMIGKSWGGFNALQIASRRPPQLCSVIAVCAADDRYSDDAHYMGGCLLNENLIWGSVLFTLNALPPDPELVGGRWRDMWQERLENDQPFPLIWLQHQRRDAYWRHGSVAEDYGSIGCPVYAISGWADGYSNAVPRLLQNLKVPCKGLVGPWGHQYPHDGRPGPAIGFLQEALRWWDFWLKDRDTGIMDEPRYRVWMPDGGSRPDSGGDQRGRWIAEPAWPSGGMGELVFHLGGPSLTDRPRATGRSTISSPQHTGIAAGSWCAFGFEGELPLDQREDDRNSACFDSAPLAEPLELLGAPRLRLTLSSSVPAAFVAVRLNEVRPDGASHRITYGLLNLAHRGGHEFPEPVRPGERFTVEFQLNDTAYAVQAGHRLRLAVSTSYWPLAWPSPHKAALTVHNAGSRLSLPVRPRRDSDALLMPFAGPETAETGRVEQLSHGRSNRRICSDPGTRETVYSTWVDLDDDDRPALERIESINLITGHGVREVFRIGSDDPLSAVARISQCVITKREDWETEVNSRIEFSSTADCFRIQAKLEVSERRVPRFENSWDATIPRDCI